MLGIKIKIFHKLIECWVLKLRDFINLSPPFKGLNKKKRVSIANNLRIL